MPRIIADTIADHRELVWRAIVSALNDLLSERDYDQISLADVASRAGIARSSIYNYATDKEALLTAVVGESVAVMIEYVRLVVGGGASSDEKLRRVVVYMLTEFAHGSRQLFDLQSRMESRTMDDSSIIGGLVAGLTSLITEVIEGGIADGSYRRSPDPLLDVQLLTGLVDRATTAVAVQGQDVAHVSDRTLTLLFAALR